jgi:hypothetical protein
MLEWFNRSGLSFAMESSERLRIASDISWEEREDDEAQPGILGLIDHTHCSAGELLGDSIVRDGLADHYVWRSG